MKAAVAVAPCSLTDLAKRIKDAHQVCARSLRESVAHAAAVGELLAEAKKLTPHGGWVVWVQKNCPFGVRTAQHYMRVADRLPDHAKTKRVSHLPLRAVLTELSAGAECTPREEQKAIAREAGSVIVNRILTDVEGRGREGTFTRAACEEGWGTNGQYATRLTEDERAAFRPLRPRDDEARVLDVAANTPNPDAPAVPIGRVSRAVSMKDRLGYEAKQMPTLRFLEAGASVVPVDARRFDLLRGRHAAAEVLIDSARKLVVFRQNGETVAFMTPAVNVYGLSELSSPVEVVVKALASIRENLDAIEGALEQARPIDVAPVAARIQRVVEEITLLHVTPEPGQRQGKGT